MSAKQWTVGDFYADYGKESGLAPKDMWVILTGEPFPKIICGDTEYGLEYHYSIQALIAHGCRFVSNVQRGKVTDIADKALCFNRKDAAKACSIISDMDKFFGLFCIIYRLKNSDEHYPGDDWP